MTNFLRKLMRNTDRIVHTQTKNAPNFQKEALRVTGGKRFSGDKRFDEIEIKLKRGRGRAFKKHLEDTHPSTRGMIELE